MTFSFEKKKYLFHFLSLLLATFWQPNLNTSLGDF